MTQTEHDPAAAPTLRLRLDLGYDGTDFHGWGRQPGGLPTVQQSLEDALEMMLREPKRVVVAGRTDAGVHARRQVVHLDLSLPQAEKITGRSGLSLEEAFLRRIDGTLSRVLGRQRGSIVVYGAREVPAEFDARFSALDRSYVYRICDARQHWDPLSRRMAWWVPQELDAARMDRALQSLVGVHDFLSFCKPREGSTTIRGLLEGSACRVEGELIEVRLRADAFCHHMVRNIVAAAVEVGRGTRSEDYLAQRIVGEKTSGLPAMAPPHGLTLESVSYPQDSELAARAAVTRALRDPLG